MNCQNVVFDLYGTLVDIWTDENRAGLWKVLAWQFCLHQAVYTPKELKRSYFRLVEQEEKKQREKCGRDAEIDLKCVFRELFENKNVQVSDEVIEEMMISFRALSIKRLKVYEGILDLLEGLKSSGKNVYLLTNAQRVFTEREIVFLGLDRWFDGILYSSEEGVKKPGVQFYEKLIERYGLDRKETVMIGNDALCDVIGAKNAGIEAIFLESNIRGSEKCPDEILRFRIEEVDLLKKELI